MDMGLFRGLMLLVMMGAFISIVVWAWSRRRREEFSEAAQLPLADDETPATPRGHDTDNGARARHDDHGRGARAATRRTGADTGNGDAR